MECTFRAGGAYRREGLRLDLPDIWVLLGAFLSPLSGGVCWINIKLNWPIRELASIHSGVLSEWVEQRYLPTWLYLTLPKCF